MHMKWKATATYPVPVRGLLVDEVFGVDRQVIGDWVTRTLEAAPVGTRVEVVEMVERVVGTYTKRPKLEELIEAGRVAAREFKELPVERQRVAIREQAISFAFGNVNLHNPEVTREMVEVEYDKLHPTPNTQDATKS